MKKISAWPGRALIGLATYLLVVGLTSLNHGSVAGGVAMPILFFGSTAILVVCGVLLLRRVR